MKLTHKIQNIFLSGSTQLSSLPKEILETLTPYTTIQEKNINITESILQLSSLISLKEKLARTFESKESIPKIIYQKNKNHTPLPKDIQILLKNLFLEKEEDIITEFIKKFNYNCWHFPTQLYPHLLNFGIRKQDLAHLINNILGEKGLWLAEKNKDWQYAIIAYKNSQEQASVPVAKPCYTAPILYAKEHIKYFPKAIDEEKWEIDLPNELTAQLRACQIKNNIYKNYDSNQNNYLIQLLRNVDPKYWISEDTIDQVNAYFKLLKSCNYQNELRKKALLLGFQKAATFYQDRDLIIAQHIYISQESSLWYEDIVNIIGQETAPLFTNEEREMIAAYYIDNILNFKRDFPDNHPFIIYLNNWNDWTENVALISVTKLSRLYQKVSDFSYAFMAMIKRAAYCIPYHLHQQITDIWQQYGEIPKPIQDSLALLKQRQILSEYYK